MASDTAEQVLLRKQLKVQQGESETECEVVLSTNYLTWSSGEGKDKVEVRVSWLLKTEVTEGAEGTDESPQSRLSVHYAVCKHKPDHGSDLSLATVIFMGPRDTCAELAQSIQTELSKKVPNRPKSLLIIINPVSGKGKGKQIYADQVAPIFHLCGIKTDVQVTQRAKHSDDILDKYDLTQVDGVIAVGGDGTFTEVVSALLKRTGKDAGTDENDPELRPDTPAPICSLISAGSGNGHPWYAGFSREPSSSALMIAIGHSQPMDITTIHCGRKFIAYALLLLGYGQMSRIFGMMENNRWAGPARYLAFPFCLFISRKMIDVEVDYLLAEIPGGTSDPSSAHEQDTSAQSEAPEAHSGSTWKTVSGNYLGIDAVTINPLSPRSNKPYFEQLTFNDGKLRLWLTKQCGRMDQVKFFDKLKKKDHTAFDVDFMECLEVKAYRIRACGEYAESTAAHNLVWDGDLIRIPEPHFEVRNHQSVLKIFTRDDGEELRQLDLKTNPTIPDDLKQT